MSRIRVALIEDHALIRIGIRTGLQQYSEIELVGEATTAATGLQLLLNTQPDVAIVDVGLPDSTGIELLRQFKRLQPTQSSQRTKILMLTMLDDRETLVAALDAGANAYCLKHIHLDELMVALQAAHRGDTWIDPNIAHLLNGTVKFDQN
jgi:DNA-binding NarL/FixJ family response regulator